MLARRSKTVAGRLVVLSVATQFVGLSCVGGLDGDNAGGSADPSDSIVAVREALTADDLHPTKPFFNSVTRATLPQGVFTLPEAVSGTPEVAPDGSATYHLPLEIPDGIEGMQPSLSVDYQGGRGGGMLGPGWNIGGLSAIVRCRRTVSQDGNNTVSALENGVPRFLRDPIYCLDGVRLVRPPDSIDPNSVGADFYPEDGTATKVVVETVDLTRGSIGGNQPASFKVYFPDGRIGYYGTTAASRIEYTRSTSDVLRYAFYVEKIADRFGNSIKFTYTRATPIKPSDTSRVVEPMPDRITYTNQGATAGPHEIVFTYQTAARPRLRYIETLAVETTTVLKSIAINSSYASFDSTGTAVAGTIRFYQFSYSNVVVGGSSVLNQIQRCTANKNASGWVPDVCTAPTKIAWTANNGLNYERIALDSIADIVPAGAQNYGRLTIADVDNDGRDDLIYKVGVDAQCAKWVYRRSTGRTFEDAIDMGLSSTCSTSGSAGAKFLSDIFPVNLDNKGAVDFITPLVVPAQNFRYTGAFTRNTSGTPAFFTFDFDGLAAATGTGPTQTKPDIGFGEMEPMVPFVIRPLIATGQSTGNWNAYRLTTNAQGTTSVSFARSIGTYFRDWPPVFVDLNGDGMDELVTPDSTAFLFFNNPITVATNLPVLRNGDQLLGRYWFMDVNGDGHKDVAYIKSSDTSPGTVLRVRMNKGDFTFGPDIVSTINNGWNIGVSGIKSGIDTGVRVADINMDGLEDMLLVDNGAALTSGTLSNGTFASQRTFVKALISSGDGQFSSDIPSPTVGSAFLPLGDIATGYDNVPAPLQGYRLTQTLDANGDGLPDLVQTEGGKLRLYLRSGELPALVRTITEGSARTVTYTVRSLNDGAARFTLTTECREAAYPKTCANRGRWIVSDLTITGPLPRHLTYKYQNPYADRAGRGFLGFAARSINDTEHNSFTSITQQDFRLADEQTVTQPAKYFYLPKTHVTETVRPGSGKLIITDTVNEPDVAEVKDGRLIVSNRRGSRLTSDCTEAPSLPFACVEADPRLLSNGSFSFNYDFYGHMTFSDIITSAQGKPDEHRQREVFYNEPDLANWLVDIPYEVSDTSQMVDGETSIIPTFLVTDGIRLRSRTRYGSDGEPYGEERFTYDPRGRLTGTVALESPDDDDFIGRHTDISYSGPGGIYPTEVTTSTAINVSQSLGKTWRHPAYGHLIQKVDPNNVLEKHVFDTAGRHQSLTDSRTAPTTFTYGLLSGNTRWQITSTFGNEKQIDDLDVLGRVVKHAWTTSTGTTASEDRGYDVLGHLSSVKSSFPSSNYETSYAFDPLGRPTSRCRSASRTLDAGGSPVAPTMECASYTYDGRKTSVVGIDGVTTEATVDEAGRLVSRVRSGVNPFPVATISDTTQFVYGPFDQPKTVTTSAGTVSFTYDPRRRVKTKSRFPNVTTYSYNSFDEVISEHHTKDPSVAGTSPDVDRFTVRDLAGRPIQDNAGTYVWDSAANGKWQLDSSQSVDGILTTHTYNANGMPATDTWKFGSDSVAIDRTYDPKGRLDTLTYPQTAFGRLAVKYNYNQFTGLVDTLVDSGTSKILWQAVTRTAGGEVVSEKMNGGQIKRDLLLYEGSLTPYNVTFQNGTTTTLSESLQYYPGGTLKSRKSTLGTSITTEQFQFDGLKRLSLWSPDIGIAGSNVAFGYADGDELATRTVGTENVTYTKSNVPGNATTNYIQRLTLNNSFTGTSELYDSDALGRTTKTPAGTFTYTAYDLPKQFVPTSGSTVDYLYDAFRGGVIKNVAGGGQEFAVAGLFRRVTSGLTVSSEHSLVVEGTVVGMIEHRAPASAGGAYANVEFYHRDQVGTPRAIGTGTAAVTRAPTRDPFGNQVSSTGISHLPTDVNSVAGAGFHGFQEQRHDLRAGLIDMNGRYYSPRIGRFMSDDPVIGDLTDGRSYSAKAFVFGDPSTFIDPTGFCSGGDEGSTDDCKEGGGGFVLIPGPTDSSWENTKYYVRKGLSGLRKGASGAWDGTTFVVYGTPGALETAYGATASYLNRHFNPFYNNQPQGHSVPGAPTTPVAESGTPIAVPNAGNRASATEATNLASRGNGRMINTGPRAINFTGFNAGAQPKGSIGDVIEMGYDAAGGWKSPEDMILSAATMGPAGKLGVRGVKGLSRAAHYGIERYSFLRKAVKIGQEVGLQVHHLIEQRFVKVFEDVGLKTREMLSVVVTPEEHRVFTNHWRSLISYGKGTANATKDRVLEAARAVYAEFPDILKKLGL